MKHCSKTTVRSVQPPMNLQLKYSFHHSLQTQSKTSPTMFNSKLKQAEHSVISNIYENDNTLVFDENDTQVMDNSLLKLIRSDGMDSHSTKIISNHIKIHTRLDFIFKLSLVCIYISFSFTIIHFAVTQIQI